MANQLVSFQLPRSYKYMKVASCGQKGRRDAASLSRPRNDSSHNKKLAHETSNIDHLKGANGAGKSTKKLFHGWMKRQQREELRCRSPPFRLVRFFFLGASVNHLLKMMRALQNCNGCSKVDKHASFDMETSCVDAYFSVPVVPATTSSTLISS